MAQDTKIEWAHHTFNPWRGCTKVSAGCANCYAETLSKRNPLTLGVWGPQGTRVVAAEKAWREPLKWDRLAAEAGERHRVFCASLADVFEDWRGPMVDRKGYTLWHLYPPSGAWTAEAGGHADKTPLTMQDVRQRLFHLIDQTPSLDWLLLTKRPENISAANGMPTMLPLKWVANGGVQFPHNVFIGTSVEDQATADERIPHLLRVPATVRFLSVEPLLGPVNLLRVDAEGFGGPKGHKIDCIRKGCWTKKFGFVNHSDMHDTFGKLHWVIVGGESGHHARPCNIEWIWGIVRQCKAARVPVFVKQVGSRPQVIAGEEDIDYTAKVKCHERRVALGESLTLKLIDPKGGDPDEWPADLRVREVPRPA